MILAKALAVPAPSKLVIAPIKCGSLSNVLAIPPPFQSIINMPISSGEKLIAKPIR
ncbi:hypothetical protein WZ342_2286 [Enterococcus faecalis]|nr:hypothetical protein WZ342_2286 [Enterococcus faecalis]